MNKEHLSNLKDQTTQATRRGFLHRGFWLWISIAIVIISLDQYTKSFFSHQLYYAERWPVLPFFDFVLLHNPGAAFSFLAGADGWQRWLFSAIALIATFLIIYWLQRQPEQKLFCLALSLILGGALGNVIDRLMHGYVIDFLLFHWQGWYFPAFNLADVAITLGAGLLILEEFLRLRRLKQHRAHNG